MLGLLALVVFVPAATARALSRAGSRRLQRAMVRANWVMICFVGLMFSGGLLGIVVRHMSDRQIGQFIIELGFGFAVLLFNTLPWWVNIRGLRSVLASKNSALAPQAESTKPGAPVSSAGH